MDKQVIPQTNISIDDGFIFEPFLDIPDLAIADLGFYHTPYSVGLVGLENVHDIDVYMSKFKYLSPSIEKIVFDYTTAEFIDATLGKNYNLSIDQKINTAKLIRDILLGTIFIGDMVSAIQKNLATNEDVAKNISSTIVAELFPPAVESIKRVQRINFPSKIQELVKAQPPTQPTAPPAPPSGFKPPAPEELKKMPLAQPSAQPVEAPKIPQEAPTPNKFISSQPQAMRPPQAPPTKPEPQQAIKPEIPKMPPQLKASDLSGIRVAPSTPTSKAGESLEKELEQVANVIDLRAKQK